MSNAIGNHLSFVRPDFGDDENYPQPSPLRFCLNQIQIIQPIDGMVGGDSFHLRPGEWIDDSSMALCLAESLLMKNGFAPVNRVERYLIGTGMGTYVALEDVLASGVR